MCQWHNHGGFFSVLRINGLQNSNKSEIEPWFSIPNEELLYIGKAGQGNKMSVSEKSRCD